MVFPLFQVLCVICAGNAHTFVDRHVSLYDIQAIIYSTRLYSNLVSLVFLFLYTFQQHTSSLAFLFRFGSFTRLQSLDSFSEYEISSKLEPFPPLHNIHIYTFSYNCKSFDKKCFISTEMLQMMFLK